MRLRLSRKLRWTIGYALSVVRLSFAFSISPLKPVNGIQRHLTGSKISCPLRSLYFSGRSEKTKWPPCPLIGWDIFDFSSETVEQNSTKLYRKQHLNVLYQICFFFFWTDRKNKMAALASDLLRHFRLLLWNRWTESNEIDRKMISISSTNFVFIWPIGKTRLSPWPLIGWDIFDFSSETAERNSTKPKRKQDLNILYQVYGFFSGRLEKQDGRPGLWLAKNIWLLLWNRWREFNENWQESRYPLPSLYFSGRLENKMAALAFDWLRHFLLLWNHWRAFNKTWQEARSRRLLPSLCLSGRSDPPPPRLVSDWLRHFRHFLLNLWTEFN